MLVKNIALLVASVGLAAAESGIDAWLRYAPFAGAPNHVGKLPSSIVALNTSGMSPVHTAGQEIHDGLKGVFSKIVPVTAKGCPKSSAVIVGTIAQYKAACGSTPDVSALGPDGFWLDNTGSVVQIIGENERGALYGAFEYLSMLSQGNFSKVAYYSNPAAPIRWINQWDNLDGSITRGFGGASIFFENNTIKEDLGRVRKYARLMASIRLNGIIINNVNAQAQLLLPVNIAGMKRIADLMRPYGVQIGASLLFSAPEVIGNLTTFDPLDPGVISFWNNVTDEVYASIPDFCGYLVKANSEGQPGPITYNRTLAQGANLFANALKPHGGIVMFRAFVYNLVDYSIWTDDRAVEAVNFFQPLDGQFHDNVVVQIKYGPIDFQVREPASPLFVNIPKTNVAIELQVAQEYLGQQTHLVYLPPLWQTIFQWDMRVNNQQSLVRDIYTGKFYNHSLGGSAAVVNVGTNQTWLGSHTAMSNLYAYGRLAWDPTQDSEEILADWTRLTFSLNQKVINTINSISMASWPAYENYSGNLGVQTLTDILYTHFGPNPISQEYNGYGQWFRATDTMIGMDRTLFNGTGNGTGFSRQYPDELFNMFENIDTTPDNLLLWFHHVPYTQKLKSGETVIQHFYNAHYAGAETANTFPTQWSKLKNLIDGNRYNDVMYKLTYQAGHSIVWRDSINEFFYNYSGIPDDLGRVHHHPWRVEAETMDLTGYKIYPVSPFETASNYTAIVTTGNSTSGMASHTITYPSGTYDIAVGYYDLYPGIAKWSAFLNDQKLGTWIGNEELRLGHELTYYLDGNSATRITFPNIKVKKGDVIKIVGTPNADEGAPVDYVAFLPKGVLD